MVKHKLCENWYRFISEESNWGKNIHEHYYVYADIKMKFRKRIHEKLTFSLTYIFLTELFYLI